MYEVIVKDKNLVAITGWAGSGKTTLANLLRDNMDYEVVSFAQPLKEIATNILGRKIDKAVDRKFLIDLGMFLKARQEFVEIYDELKIEKVRAKTLIEELKETTRRSDDIFARLLVQKIKPEGRYVIDDLRFNVEYGILKANNFVISKLECEQKLCEFRLKDRDGGFDPKTWESPSEKEHLAFDFDVIVYSGGPATRMYDRFFEQLIRLGQPGIIH